MRLLGADVPQSAPQSDASSSPFSVQGRGRALAEERQVEEAAAAPSRFDQVPLQQEGRMAAEK